MGYTASGLRRRTAPQPTYGVHVTPTGCHTVWPPGIGDYYRPVVLTRAHKRPDGSWYGHRRADGSHMNTVANRVCHDCVVEAELEYLRAVWRSQLTFMNRRPPGRRRRRG